MGWLVSDERVFVHVAWWIQEALLAKIVVYRLPCQDSQAREAKSVRGLTWTIDALESCTSYLILLTTITRHRLTANRLLE